MVEGQAASDFVLVDAWHRGDQAASHQLIKQYYESIARFFQTKVAEGVWQDLVQQTFLACLGGASQYRGQARFRSFLYAIARNVLSEYLRQSIRRRTRVDSAIDVDDADETPIPSSELSPVATAVQHQEQQLLLEALRRIPRTHQAVLKLYYWEDLTAAEIGDVLKIPTATVKTRLRDGRVHLRKQFNELCRASEAPRDAVADRDGTKPDDLVK